MRTTLTPIALGLVTIMITCASCRTHDPKDDAPLPVLDRSARTNGCAKHAENPSDLKMTTRGGRTFHVYGPRAIEPGRAYPVVVAYHGWQSNGRAFASWFKMHEHVNGNAFVVYPDSDGDLWDLAGEKDLQFFDAMRVDLADAFCIDLRRIYVFGFSYGGKFVNHIACKRADDIRAFAIGDASLGADHPAACKTPVPLLVTHRTKDPDELFEWGKNAATVWAGVNGCAKDTDISDAAHGCTTYRECKQPVVFCEDTFFDPKWPKNWNHTVREEYRDVVWHFFDGYR